MITWLFQTVNKRRVDQIERGYVDRWCVRRYRDHMQQGDRVFIWLGGAPAVRGVHGWGKLAAAPYSHEHAFFVDVQYEHVATPFLPASTLRNHPVLHRLPILHMPRATNFKLEDAHAVALTNLLNAARQA